MVDELSEVLRCVSTIHGIASWFVNADEEIDARAVTAADAWFWRWSCICWQQKAAATENRQDECPHGLSTEVMQLDVGVEYTSYNLEC